MNYCRVYEGRKIVLKDFDVLNNKQFDVLNDNHFDVDKLPMEQQLLKNGNENCFD